MHRLALAATLRLGLLLASAGVVGALAGDWRLGLVLALLAAQVYALHALYRILRWLPRQRQEPPPEGYGSWFALVEHLYRQWRPETQHKRRLLRLLRAFREAAAALPDGAVVLHAQRRIQWFNESAARLLRLQAPRDRGQRVDDFLPLAARHWLTGPNAAEPLWDVPAPHDDRIRLSLRLIPYGDEQRLLVIRDISRLVGLEQVRQNFVANASHELRTPLTVLRGYLDMLGPQDVHPRWHDALAELRHQAQRMQDIVQDLLTLSEWEVQTELPDAPVAMQPLLETLAREARALARDRLRIEVCNEAPGHDLLGSFPHLYSAFSNLVANAVRHTPDQGQVTLSWVLQRGQPTFSVRDTGCGIPAEHIPRLTERFYRVSASRSRQSGGTGLGLSIVKHALGLHQAHLRIESEVGVGSTFSCVFPAARSLIDGTPPPACGAGAESL